MPSTRDIVVYGGITAGLGFMVWKWGNPVTAISIAAQWAANLVGRGNASHYYLEDHVRQYARDILESWRAERAVEKAAAAAAAKGES